MPDNNIELIEGNNNILLIAPHGHPKNDTYTGVLTRELYQRLGCYAVINEYYCKPYKGHPTNKNAGIANLNYTHLIEKAGMEKDFLLPILDFKQEIIAKEYGSPVVVLIHGMDDDNMKNFYGDDTQVVMGIGNPDRLSCNEDFPNKFKPILNTDGAKGLVTVIDEGGTDYSAWDYRNLNQLFTERNLKYYDDRVQSFQLELKMAGVRAENHISQTADILSSALAKITVISLAVEKDPEVEILPTEAPLASTKQELDTHKIEEACSTIQNIFIQHYYNAMLEVGRYIISTFYGGDYDQARNKNHTQHKSLRQLFKRLQQADDAPKKSWLYNAVNLAVDEHDYQGFHAYGNLGLSQKVKLLSIEDQNKKEQLII